MEHSMTKGKTTSLLLWFSVPILIGDLFQQLYNLVDSIIVGKYVSKEAFAALGVASPIMSLVIAIIIGLCIGTSALMAQFYGAKDEENLKKEMSTSLIAGIVFTLIVSTICIFLTDWMLEMTNTPFEIFDMAKSYLSIIFVGMIFTFIYNFT